MRDVARGDEISAVGIDIDGHQLVLLVVPQNLRYIDLHEVVRTLPNFNYILRQLIQSSRKI